MNGDQQPLPLSNDHHSDEEKEALDFDQQYEQMIKVQLGGMLQGYIDYSNNELPTQG